VLVRVRNEGRGKDSQDGLGFSTSIFPKHGKFQPDAHGLEFDFNDQKLRLNGMPSPSRVVDAVRRFGEIEFATSLVPRMPARSLVVLDGTLEAAFSGEESTLAGIYERCAQRGIAVCSIAKTSRLLAKDGHSIIDRVAGLDSGGTWHARIADSRRARHRACIFCVKLHASSRFVFRFEICSDNAAMARDALAYLASNSRDAAFLGYPYGLVDADRFARVSGSELQYYKTVFMVKAGRQWRDIAKEMSALNAHSVLDSI
jgi:hypothetical protein